ncbi:MAG: Fic family protein [Gammaproteobacteria bacterium]|jgi:cell filamentation protein|nr:Fic family protein [Gammaproteobacteria bacterium]
MRVNRIVWRWEERDFGFRFCAGKGQRTEEYYQAVRSGEFYSVPKSKRKLKKERVDALAKTSVPPTSPKVVKLPWQDYDQDWDWITTADGVLLNYAGCLDREELNRREDEGVARAMEYVASLLERPDPVPLTLNLLQQIHRELMGQIYPFAGGWRSVCLHKGDGPTKWPLPPSGIQPLMDVLERDLLKRSPVISDDDHQVFGFVSEVMNELLAIHPFREGNGRAAFIVGNLILMQNGMLPLDVYDRKSDEGRYFDACEAGRVQKDYTPLAGLIAEWEDAALARWEASHEA